MKTFGFLLVTAALPFAFFYLKQNNKDFQKGVALYNAESEVSSGIYTGQIRDVYNPLDQAYQVTEQLRKIVNSRSSVKSYGEMPSLSLYLDPVDLDSSDRGIRANGGKTGRLWERAGFVEIIDNGKPVYQDYAGVRLHGGSSRSSQVKLKSYRLYARKSYESDVFPSKFNISFSEKNPIRRLVIRRDTHIHFANEISFFLINQLGGLAPKSKQITFYLNEEFQGFHLLHEHLSEEQLSGLVGHKDFLLAKLKGDKNLNERLQYLSLRTKMEMSPEINFDYVEKLVDMDSTMSSLLVIMYTGMSDWAQGTYIKDLKEKSPWKLISWDFDRAFYPVRGESYEGVLRNPFEMKSVALGIDMKKGTVRWSIFNRLIVRDKKFRTYFSELVDKLFDDVLGGSDFISLLSGLRARANSTTGVSSMSKDLDDIENFIKYRKEVFCRDLLKLVKLSPKTCKKP